MAMRHLDKNLDIHTFSFISDDPIISEEHWVDILGRTANIAVHKVRPEELVADLTHFISVQEEPFYSTSMYAQHRVFQLAREVGIKVMLNGQGADEMLGGYNYYTAARLASLLRQGKWVKAVRLLRSASRLPGVGALWTLIRATDFLVPSILQDPLRRWIKKELTPSWLNVKWFKVHEVEVRRPNYGSGREVLKASLYHTLTETGLPYLLRYEDRNSMAFSIESRVPFLTPELVNFMFALPEEYLIAPDGTTKAVFRKAMRGIVPDAILDRKDKIGFATPEKYWLLMLSSWVERILSSEVAIGIRAINVEKVQREWKEIVQGQKQFDFRVWRWINLVLWAEKFAVNIK
jgi:asparagine synthase (glutamine-hydrolysing)